MGDISQLMYRQKTHGFEVSVEPTYLPEESSVEEGRYTFSYRVRITNRGKTEAQLIARHWIIVDGHGSTNEVEGEGVVGEQPWLMPGETFEYSSFCPLSTPMGKMRGSYRMADIEGNEFYVSIPQFQLQDRRIIH